MNLIIGYWFETIIIIAAKSVTQEQGNHYRRWPIKMVKRLEPETEVKIWSFTSRLKALAITITICLSDEIHTCHRANDGQF